jgi:hypothetical protein
MQHMRVSHGRNATHASFSPAEVQHMRVSPREKCNVLRFSPGKMQHGIKTTGRIN